MDILHSRYTSCDWVHWLLVGFMTNSPVVHSTAQIGISVEPLAQLEAQTPAANTTATTVDSFLQFSSKMLENLYNYVSSFGVTQAQMTPNPGETYVPISALHNWFTNFKRKMEQDPNFWKSSQVLVSGSRTSAFRCVLSKFDTDLSCSTVY